MFGPEAVLLFRSCGAVLVIEEIKYSNGSGRRTLSSTWPANKHRANINMKRKIPSNKTVVKCKKIQINYNLC